MRVGVKYAKQAKVFDIIEVTGTGNCFKELKHHKTNFINHPTTRLVSPAENEIARIIKELLDSETGYIFTYFLLLIKIWKRF